MVQVLKPAVRERIEQAALRCFAEQGYPGTSMARIAAVAGTAVANVYRYVPSKQALLEAVVPAELADRHDRLLDHRVAALAEGVARSEAADELLAFWLDHRLAVAVLLDRAEGTPYAGYPEAFVARLVAHVEQALPGDPGGDQRELLHLVFDNTRRALAVVLRTARDREHAQRLVHGFWSYQLPGLDGLVAHLRSAGPGPRP